MHGAKVDSVNFCSQYTPPFELPICSQDRGTSRTAALKEKKRHREKGGGGERERWRERGRERGRERWRERGRVLEQSFKNHKMWREEESDEEEKNERQVPLGRHEDAGARYQRREGSVLGNASARQSFV
jgi:hypothetical protein